MVQRANHNTQRGIRLSKCWFCRQIHKGEKKHKRGVNVQSLKAKIEECARLSLMGVRDKTVFAFHPSMNYSMAKDMEEKFAFRDVHKNKEIFSITESSCALFESLSLFGTG
jgi:hypothetical protein